MFIGDLLLDLGDRQIPLPKGQLIHHGHLTLTLFICRLMELLPWSGSVSSRITGLPVSKSKMTQLAVLKLHTNWLLDSYTKSTEVGIPSETKTNYINTLHHNFYSLLLVEVKLSWEHEPSSTCSVTQTLEPVMVRNPLPQGKGLV